MHAGALQGIVGENAHARLAKDLVVGSRQKRRKPNIKKLIKEVQSSGLDVSAVKVAPDYTITFDIGKSEEQAETITPLDAWKAKRARSA